MAGPLLTLRFREQLPKIVVEELDQLLAALNVAFAGLSTTTETSTLPDTIVASVYRGVIVIANGSLTNTATIPAVDMTRSSLRFLGSSVGTAGSAADTHAQLTFTNSTTITATRGSNINPLSVGFEVITFNTGVVRRIQRGSISMVAVVSNTATLSFAVNTGKSTCGWLGSTNNDNTSANGAQWVGVVALANSNTVSATHGVAGATVTSGYEVVEWM